MEAKMETPKSMFSDDDEDIPMAVTVESQDED